MRGSLLTLGLLMAASTAQAATVQTPLGALSGVDGVADTDAFLGVPYAQPPVGEARWKAPRAAQPWAGVKQAAAFGPACPQAGPDGPTGDEDCLYLNVWRPKAASGPRPVLFWIHGGANVLGESALASYDGGALADATDVVVVSINYRLGPFGYLDHPALSTGDRAGDSGNFATLDIVEALRWVQANIASFGGDPDQVTVFGESAGGWNTWSAVLSPLTDGLMHGAIAQSGCPDFLTVTEAQDAANHVVEQLVVADGLAAEDTAADYIASQGLSWVRTYLYSKSADALLQGMIDTGGVDGGSFDPIADGYVLPSDVVTTLSRGTYKDVPMILGSNRDEMKLFSFYLYDMGPVTFQNLMRQYYGNLTRDIVSLYPRSQYAEPRVYNQFTDIQDAYLEVVCSLYPAQLVSPHHDLWVYSFQYDNLTDPYDTQFGACHASEIGFVFGTATDELYAADSQGERELLTQEMQARWGCFAHTGDPNACRTLDSWPQFTNAGPGANQRMIFDANLRVQALTSQELDRLDYWVDLYGLNSPWY